MILAGKVCCKLCSNKDLNIRTSFFFFNDRGNYNFFFYVCSNKNFVAAKINTPTIQCDMCKERIETYLKRYDGVTYVNVNVKKKGNDCKISYWTALNIENI